MLKPSGFLDKWSSSKRSINLLNFRISFNRLCTWIGFYDCLSHELHSYRNLRALVRNCLNGILRIFFEKKNIIKVTTTYTIIKKINFCNKFKYRITNLSQVSHFSRLDSANLLTKKSTNKKALLYHQIVLTFKNTITRASGFAWPMKLATCIIEPAALRDLSRGFVI